MKKAKVKIDRKPGASGTNISSALIPAIRQRIERVGLKRKIKEEPGRLRAITSAEACGTIIEHPRELAITTPRRR